MKTCYRCDTVLTNENKSNEHIIPNSCGGHLKSPLLLCASCNSFFGSTADKELADQINYFANILNIKKDNGDPENVKGIYIDSGEDVVLRPNGTHGISHPIVEYSNEGEHIQITIIARNEGELEKIKLNLKKNYKQINQGETTKEKRVAPIITVNKISIEAKKSIVKSIINYYILNEGDKKYVRHLISYIEGTVEFKNVYLYYPDNWAYTPENKEISNVIRIIGDPSQKLLYGYIEIFNAFNYIVLLNDKYDGPNLNLTYVYDVLLNKQLFPEIPLSLNKNSLVELFSKKNETPLPNFLVRRDRVLTIAAYRHYTKVIQEAIVNIIQEYLDNNPNANTLPKDLGNIIEKRIFEIPFPVFKTGTPTPESPPQDKNEKKKWLQNKTKGWFD